MCPLYQGRHRLSDGAGRKPDEILIPYLQAEQRTLPV